MKFFLVFIFIIQAPLCANTLFKVHSNNVSLHDAKLLQYKDLNDPNVFEKTSVPLDQLFPNKNIQLINGKFAVPVSDFKNLLGLSVLKEFCSGICSFQFELFIKDTSAIKDIVFLYSSTKVEERDTAYFLSLEKAKRNSWTNLNLWVPDYSPLNGKGLDLQFSNPTRFKEVDLSSALSHNSRNAFIGIPDLSSQNDIYVHSISIKKSNLTDNIEQEQDTIQKAFLLFPSHFEKTTSMRVLGITFLFFVIFFSIRVRKKIGLKILLGFFIPMAFAIAFLSVQGLNDFLYSIETSQLYKIQKKMQKEVLQVNSLGEKIENGFMKIIEKSVIPEIKVKLKKLRQNKIDLSTNHYADYRSERYLFNTSHPNVVFQGDTTPYPLESTLDLQLQSICEPYDLNIMLANSSTIYHSDDYYTTKSIRYISSVFQKYIQNEVNGLSANSKSSRDSIKMLKDLMSKGFDDTKILDRFMNNPSQLFHLKVRSMASNKSVSKTFWSYLVEEHNDKQIAWFIFGGVGRTTLVNSLKSYLNELFNSPQHYSDDYLFFGDNLLGTFTSEKRVNSTMLEIASLAKKNLTLSFLPKLDHEKLYFYSYHIYEPSPGYSFVLKKSGEDYLKSIQQQKNRIYYSIYFLFAVIYLAAYILSRIVTNPLHKLTQGMIKIKEGDIQNDLISRGKDQFSDVTHHLNLVLSSLREKEHLSKFLSNMVLNSLDSKELASTRQDQYIMFCGIQNLKSLEEIIGLEKVVDIIDQFLQKVQSSIVSHNGRIDKFTGKSSLSVFDANLSTERMIHLLLELRQKLSEFNISNPSQIQIKFGIGIAKGPVVLGNVGSKHRKDFTAIGSTVNKAARLEALAAKTSDLVNIYFDQQCLDSFSNTDKINYQKCDSVQLKGYQKEQSVYELL
ncbi:MAG: hypothetical protein KC646_00820 [Candidatus Cloacimonetes bacterium]|nr:hypothetical protein [Candidatus Cloacimonadota bacterium]